jgi:hypothetical protein
MLPPRHAARRATPSRPPPRHAHDARLFFSSFRHCIDTGCRRFRFFFRKILPFRFQLSSPSQPFTLIILSCFQRYAGISFMARPAFFEMFTARERRRQFSKLKLPNRLAA